MTYQIHSRRKIAAGLGAAMLPSQFVAFAQAQPQNTLLKRPIAHGGGETLPVIGLGTAVVFNIGANAPERAGPTAVVRTFVGSGATLIDTAPSYGTRETVAGDILTATSLRPRVFKRWLERGPRVASLRARVSPPVRRCVATSVLHSKRRRMKRLARPAHVGCSVQLLCGRQSLR